MITATNAFKEAQRGDAKQVLSYLTDGSDIVAYNDDLTSLKLKAVGNIGTTVMRQLVATYMGSHYAMGTVLTPNIGAYVSNDDNFDDNSLDVTEKWVNWGGGNVVNSGGVLNVSINTGTGYKGIDSRRTFDFTSGIVRVKVVSVGNQAEVNYECSPIEVLLDEDNLFNIYVSDGSVVYNATEAGVGHTLATETYDSDLHVYFRLLQSGTKVYYQRSADGFAWVTVAERTVAFAITAVIFECYAGRWAGSGSVTSMVIDDVFLPATAQYLGYGEFAITELQTSENKQDTTIKAYDKMHEALIDYDLTNSGDYPLTVLQLLQAICTRLSWTLATTTFTNSALSIASERYATLGYKFRDVLDDIAEITGSIIRFGNNNQLYVVAVSETSLETLGIADLNTLLLKRKWGELNSLVLAREPSGDYIASQDAGSIASIGLFEFKLTNNQLAINDSESTTAIADLYTALHNIDYYPFTATTVGLGYYEIGDCITVTDLASNTYKVFVFDIEISVTGGITEVVKADTPANANTPYEFAGILGKTIKDTQIIVDKVQGQIDILSAEVATATIPRQSTPPATPSVNDLYLDTDDNIIYLWDGATWQPTSIAPSTLDDYYTKDETEAQITVVSDAISASVSSVQEQANLTQAQADALSTAIGDDETEGSVIKRVSDLELTATQITQRVTQVGGINLLKNSAGLKGTITEWQVLDEAGNPVDIRNNGTVDQSTDTQQNSTANSGISISNQFIEQTIPTLVGVSYMFYCKFKKDCATTVTINGVVYTITADSYVDDTWAVFSVPFTAEQVTTTIRLENTTVGGYAVLADMIVKAGIANEWEQAPNEVYTVTSTFDKDGFTVISVDGKFKAVMAGGSFTLYDVLNGNTIVAYFDITTGKINKLTAQGETVFRRYENPAKSLRVIPVDDGIIEVIND